MDPDVFTGTIQALKRLNPFRPFTVVTMSGGRQEVDFADAIVLRDGVAIFAAPGDIPVIFDHDSVDQVIGDPSGQSA